MLKQNVKHEFTKISKWLHPVGREEAMVNKRSPQPVRLIRRGHLARCTWFQAVHPSACGVSVSTLGFIEG